MVMPFNFAPSAALKLSAVIAPFVSNLALTLRASGPGSGSICTGSGSGLEPDEPEEDATFACVAGVMVTSLAEMVGVPTTFAEAITMAIAAGLSSVLVTDELNVDTAEVSVGSATATDTVYSIAVVYDGDVTATFAALSSPAELEFTFDTSAAANAVESLIAVATLVAVAGSTVVIS